MVTGQAGKKYRGGNCCCLSERNKTKKEKEKKTFVFPLRSPLDNMLPLNDSTTRIVLNWAVSRLHFKYTAISLSLCLFLRGTTTVHTKKRRPHAATRDGRLLPRAMSKRVFHERTEKKSTHTYIQQNAEL